MEATIPGAVGVGPPSAALDYEHPKSWALNLDWLSWNLKSINLKLKLKQDTWTVNQHPKAWKEIKHPYTCSAWIEKPSTPILNTCPSADDSKYEHQQLAPIFTALPYISFDHWPNTNKTQNPQNYIPTTLQFKSTIKQPKPSTLNGKSSILNPNSLTLNSKPCTMKPEMLNPQKYLWTLNHIPLTLNHEPLTQNLGP